MGIIQRVLATDPNLTLNNNLASITADNIVQVVIRWVGGIAGIIAFLFLIYGGFMYLTAAGNAEQSKKGGQAIINAVIGLIIIALAYAITSYIIGILNRPV